MRTGENTAKLTFPSMFAETLRRYGERAAYAFAGEDPKSYESVNRDILALMAMIEKNGISPGDKVAILSSNMPNWGIAFFAVTFMGAVAVPILPDFSPPRLEIYWITQELRQFSFQQHYYHV